MSQSNLQVIVRHLFAPLAFVITTTVSGQALAFDAVGLSYSVIGATNDVQVEGCAASPCSSNAIVIPDTVVDGGTGTTYSVTSIANGAFANPLPPSVFLTSVSIGNNVTRIGDNAFSEITTLTTVTFGNSVETIGDGAFSSCPLLEGVDFPASLVTIGASAFNNSGLKRVIIPDGVDSIGFLAFTQNQLTTLDLGTSVASIGVGAFGTNQLTNIIIPESVSSIGSAAFGENTLNSVAFKGDFVNFPENTFAANSNLTTITYCADKMNWPQTFNVGTPPATTLIAATPDPLVCQVPPVPPTPPPAAAPVPVSPLWLLGIMTGLLSLVGMRRLRKT